MGCNGSTQASAGAAVNAGPQSKVLNESRGEGERPSIVVTSVDFEVLLERKAFEDIGVQFASCEDKLVVKEILAEGLVPTWNSKHGMDSKCVMKKGDVVVSVNGVKGDASKMMEQTRYIYGVVTIIARHTETSTMDTLPISESAVEELNAPNRNSNAHENQDAPALSLDEKMKTSALEEVNAASRNSNAPENQVAPALSLDEKMKTPRESLAEQMMPPAGVDEQLERVEEAIRDVVDDAEKKICSCW